MNSKNVNEWVTAEMVTGMGELPKSASNVTRRATKENWVKRQKRGKRGVAYEYHYSSLPDEVQRLLGFGLNDGGEWIELKDLLGVAGLPETVQGVTKKAKAENWERRLIEGRKGKTFEYQISSMPLALQNKLNFSKNLINEPVAPYRIERRTNDEDLTEVSKARFLTAISTLEEILAMTRKTMEPEAKAQMVWMIYELLSEESANEKIINLVKLVA
ncbi:DNA-binding protein [Aggregatibacter actinomycetemcomitans]|uniref:DNA-binding protein n=2 Tax=Aggregatibacter actinomycetemcomitans TaxID=714 RepID=UPI0021CC9FD9|nr:DNA-binding protein [Aggregatibacter actinomycetemcomitans]